MERSEIVKLGLSKYGAALETTLEARVPKATSPVAESFTATFANTEYSFTLPAGTKRFTLKARGGAINFGFATGVRPITIVDGGAYWDENLDLPSAITVYFSSPVAGVVVEVVRWS